ncbi:MAG: TauD/TfdA family dioxygenase [Gammaproteobacteria bacterium]
MNALHNSPYQLDTDRAYRAWRARKLDAYPDSLGELRVEMAGLDTADPSVCAAVAAACRRANMALVSCAAGEVEKTALQAFGRRLGLHTLDVNLHADDDGISALQVAEAEGKRDYIPYTNRALNWHTDGYYNAPGQQIRAFLIICAKAAAEGGENQLLDHEIAYILLRDADPRFVQALMHPQALTIPANIDRGVEIRPAETGPVFSVDSAHGNLHMRYSARTRNIRWRDDPVTRDAVAFLAELWERGCGYIYHHRLMPGQGIVCNNVLHSRSAFRDDPAAGRSRLLYRARYFERISGTDFADSHPGWAASA